MIIFDVGSLGSCLIVFRMDDYCMFGLKCWKCEVGFIFVCVGELIRAYLVVCKSHKGILTRPLCSNVASNFSYFWWASYSLPIIFGDSPTGHSFRIYTLCLHAFFFNHFRKLLAARRWCRRLTNPSSSSPTWPTQGLNSLWTLCELDWARQTF